MLSALGILAAVLSLALPASAQTTSVSGRVLDQAGAVIPGVTVTLTSITARTRTTVSNELGFYQFLQLAPGAYEIKAELSGFKTAVVSDLKLLVDEPRTLDLKMEIGELTETVTVEASAAKLNTTDATLGSAFEAKRIVELPLESRNVANLLSLQAAVTSDGYVSGSRSDQSNLTLDGIDVNEQQQGTAFETVLRVNPDSVQEFRVTTNTPTAAQGRSSGGQVSLITRTGTNDWHGALYEYHRNTVTTANDFFNNRTFVNPNDPSKGTLPTPKLLRNLFGGTISGPIKKDRIFFFYNYEGRRDAKETPVGPNLVPLPSMGEGKLKYLNKSGGITTLTTAQLNPLYPTGMNPITIALMADAAKRYPANDPGTGDGLNTSGYRFNAPLPLAYNGHTATLSFNIDSAARHVLTLRGNYQHDSEKLTPQFPDTPIPSTWSHPVGYAATHTWTVTPKAVNTLRFGLTRQAYSDQGDSSKNNLSFRGVFSPLRYRRTFSRVTPTWNIVDDLAWVHGNHTWQFGTNIRFIRNERVSFGNSYDSGTTNYYFYENSGAVLVDPLTDLTGSTTDVKAAVSVLIGRLVQYSGNFNFNVDGSMMPQGVGAPRTFATEEYEFYAQDVWRVRNDLTLTLGIRYGLNTPVYESTGFQVKPTESLTQYFELRKAWAAAGRPYDKSIQVDLAGPKNNLPGFYEMDKNNFAPRFAFAWSPEFENSLLRKIFGTGRKSVIRGGYAATYDRIGSRLAVSFDTANTLGFSSTETIPANTYNTTSRPGPLFTGYDMNIRALPNLTIPSKLVFPLSKPADGATRIESTLDDGLTTPIQHMWNFSIAREFGRGLTIEASYIGRSGRNLLAQRDVMHPNNIVDPKSGMDWCTAAAILYDERWKGTLRNQIQTIPFFENMFPNYRRLGLANATQSVYSRVSRDSSNLPDWTYVQYAIDDRGIYPNMFFQPQYGALSVWSTVGYSDYHAGTLSVRQRLSSFNFDFNYTFSKSTDIGSGLEREGSYSGGAFFKNPLRPEDMHAVSEFDMTHIINGNVLWELPFGRGRSFLNSLHPVADALLGGWQLTSIFRYNTGTPIDAPNDYGIWATNWQTTSWGTRIQPIEPSPRKSGTHPNYWADPKVAYNSFRNAKAGETGERNIFRRLSYVTLDFGLAKSFRMPWGEGHRVQLRWEVFNATNTNILSSGGGGLDIDCHIGIPAADFGNITSTQGSPRVMQFGLRYDF